MGEIAVQLADVQRQVDDAGGATLVAVSKGQSIQKIQAAYDAGHRDFGESYVDEMAGKVDRLPSDIRWHFIGPIQSRKVKSHPELFRLCALIHVVDRESVAKAIANRVYEGTPIDVLLQVNVGDEPQKSGVPTTDVLQTFARLADYEQLRFRGLMAIPPFDQEPAPFFETLRGLFDTIQTRYEPDGWTELSMGMSGDFVEAIEHGATIVRVGTAIFGERHYE